MTTGKDLRDAGIALTLDNPLNAGFIEDYGIYAEAFIRRLKPGTVFTFDDINRPYRASSHRKPAKTAAYGGVAQGIIGRLTRECVIRQHTFSASLHLANHGHRYSSYQRV